MEEVSPLMPTAYNSTSNGFIGEGPIPVDQSYDNTVEMNSNFQTNSNIPNDRSSGNFPGSRAEWPRPWPSTQTESRPRRIHILESQFQEPIRRSGIVRRTLWNIVDVPPLSPTHWWIAWQTQEKKSLEKNKN
jgi:hypothetical protein